ncbi:MAG: hypothetical protein HQL26_02260 [Candidatus Omnitrophica bacterium]|nr:hypothetical protein [Candidatus Omnitrophota bacterium]
MKKIVIGLILFLCFQIAIVKAEPNISIPEDIFKALDNLKDDNLQLNCTEAALYLYDRREKIVDILINVLPKLDWQGQDVILKILTETETYSPNEYIIKLMLERIKDERSPNIRNAHDIYHYDYIPYIRKYAKQFKDELRTYIKIGNIRQLWVVTHILVKENIFDEISDAYSPKLMNFVIKNLRDDNIDMNASYSARICFLIGKNSLPYLKQEVKDGDAQSKEIAKTLVRYISENRRFNPDDLWEFVDELSVSGVTLGSTYLDRIEREGASKLPDFWFGSNVSKQPKFLISGKYTNRQQMSE